MKSLDLNNLSDLQVKKLIRELKYSKDQINLSKLKNPHNLKIDERQNVINFRLNLEYFVAIKRGKIEKDRFSISIIFKETYHTLVRVDVKGGKHTNPDGSIAPKTHIHIYNNKYDKKDRFAYPIDLNAYPGIYDIVNAYIQFLDCTNIEDNL
ncbi:hypothetical protein QJ847_03905 [Staphylococcus hominis]|uniref:DUF6978 family protein n=1 Tax=Staphylococcus hominis TaxID=1290 RepID=UPI0034CF92FF